MRSRIQVTNSGPEQLARRANLNRQLNESRYGYSVREYWHGETVRIPKNGDLRIFVSTSRPALLLRLGKKIHVKIQGYGSPAVIIFSKTAIVLKVGESIVYEKSRKKLLGLKHGLKWVEQIDREVINLEQQRSKANPWLNSLKNSELRGKCVDEDREIYDFGQSIIFCRSWLHLPCGQPAANVEGLDEEWGVWLRCERDGSITKWPCGVLN